MERRIWAWTKGKTLWPNLYMILVATPGVGKSNILSAAEDLLRRVPDISVAPSSMTTASLIDTMALCKQQRPTPGLANGAVVEYNSLAVVSSELGVFLPAWDPAFLNTLTKLYDGEMYEERRRTGKVQHLVIESPLLTIMGGSTPSYLGSMIPEMAWEQGFTSRIIFIFSNQAVKVDIWGDPTDETITTQLQTDLVSDLKSMHDIYGRMEFDKECQKAITEWEDLGYPPTPEHIKLQHYNPRRLTHLLKLCMVASIARSNERLVRMEDLIRARSWLLEAERVMPEVFNKMVKSADGNVVDEAKFYLKTAYDRGGGKPINEAALYIYLRNKTQAYNIKNIIEAMEKSGEIKRTYVTGLPYIIPTWT